MLAFSPSGLIPMSKEKQFRKAEHISLETPILARVN
jgi:hypothetical protein